MLVRLAVVAMVISMLLVVVYPSSLYFSIYIIQRWLYIVELLISLVRTVIIVEDGVNIGAACSCCTGYFNVVGGSLAKFIAV